MPREDAERIVRASVNRAARVVSLTDPNGRKAATQLLELLRAADVRLARKLSTYASGEAVTFTAAHAASMRAQMAVVASFVEARLLGLTEETALRAVVGSIQSTANLIEKLEMAFKGVNTPLALRQASVMSRLANGTRSSLLAQHETSVDRYKTAMIMQMERRMMVGLLENQNVDQVVDNLVSLKGPRGRVSIRAKLAEGKVVRLAEEDIEEGLFVRYRYWAERIVRTETANAYEEAGLRSLYEAKNDLPDMQKKIMAVFDNRTAADSIAVHGQIRPLDGMFIDGAGRQYLRPPARPNDRETVIPWRPEWTESPETTPTPAKEAAKAIVANSRVTVATRKQAATSGAAQRLAQANQSAVALRVNQAAAQAQARRGEAAVSAEESGRVVRRRTAR